MQSRITKYPVCEVDEHITAHSDDVIDIVIPMGSVTIEGWEQHSVSVGGTIGKHIVGLKVSKSENAVLIKTILPDVTNIANLDLAAILIFGFREPIRSVHLCCMWNWCGFIFRSPERETAFDDKNASVENCC